MVVGDGRSENDAHVVEHVDGLANPFIKSGWAVDQMEELTVVHLKQHGNDLGGMRSLM